LEKKEFYWNHKGRRKNEEKSSIKFEISWKFQVTVIDHVSQCHYYTCQNHFLTALELARVKQTARRNTGMPPKKVK